ncbi:MAG: ATP-binding protein, partial [Paracoccaceae bacterium]|nr:ATP-binding protein [Paracoccaceae bacterium]
EEFAPMAAAKGLGFRVVPARLMVLSDAAYLRRILQNLIGNALRYTETGRVLVGVRRRGPVVQLEVRDTGPGIPEDEQDNVFKEFHRLNARASASDGMGLGLAIVERAAALLGHPLGLRSDPGCGTCFLVQLPLAGAALAQIRAAQPVSRDGLPDKIALLIEPDDDLRRAIGLLLEKWGMSVLDAATMDEALALIDEIGILPDVLLVDPVAGAAAAAGGPAGREGLRMIAGFRARHGALPACLITADRTPGLALDGAADGVSVLQKPMDAPGLRRFLQQAFAPGMA